MDKKGLEKRRVYRTSATSNCKMTALLSDGLITPVNKYIVYSG